MSEIPAQFLATPAEVEDTSFLVHAHKLAIFVEKIDKANRRLERNGLDGRFAAVQVGEKTATRGNGIVDHWYRFELERPEFNAIADWKFVATVKFEEGGTLLQVIPGETLHGAVDREALDSHWCDHCHTARNRNRSYLVRNTETGEIKQIGSTCLELFFGVEIKGLWALEWTMEDFSEGDDESWGSDSFYRVPFTYNVRFVLALAHVLTNGGQGFISRGVARDDERKTATADEVLHNIHFRPRSWRDADEAARVEKNMAAAAALVDTDVVDSVLAAAGTLSEGDYKDNMTVAVRSESITGAALGVLVSLITVWHRNNEKAANAEREAKATDKLNEFVGAKKERLRDLALVVTRVHSWEGDFGTTTLLAMEDAQGRSFKWFASKWLPIEAGDTLKLTGTVKEHSVYQGRKETVLTRCTLNVATA